MLPGYTDGLFRGRGGFFFLSNFDLRCERRDSTSNINKNMITIKLKLLLYRVDSAAKMDPFILSIMFDIGLLNKQSHNSAIQYMYMMYGHDVYQNDSNKMKSPDRLIQVI